MESNAKDTTKQGKVAINLLQANALETCLPNQTLKSTAIQAVWWQQSCKQKAEAAAVFA
jgi:hypothetical protein